MSSRTHVIPNIDGIAPAHQPAVSSAAGWPLVLYFHHVHPEFQDYTSLTPEEFERGLETVLAEFESYEPRNLTSVDGPYRADTPTVLITFDDGYRDNITFALPILERLGLRALFFVSTDLLGRSSPDPRADFASIEEFAALEKSGHRIGAHSRNHIRLDQADLAEVEAETYGSLEAVTAKCGPTPTRLFAYPYGAIPAGFELPEDVLGFGTVRSPAQPWTAAPHAIRRTYLPSNNPEMWGELTRYWKLQWRDIDSPNRKTRYLV
ncbi:polysaccharide deacetylase family protein [Nocardia sp. NPDC004722]